MLKFLIIFTMTLSLIACTNLVGRNTTEVANHNSTSLEDGMPKSAIPEGWKIVPNPPKEQRLCANRSGDERKVLLKNEVIHISQYVYHNREELPKLPPTIQKFVSKQGNIGNGLAGYLHIEPFDNGWLIGSDAGEWGGMLNWFDADGKQRNKILVDNIRGITKVGEEVLILTGLAHLSTDEGKIYKLTKDKKAVLLTDLKTQPQNVLVENDNSIIVSLKDKIIRVKSSGEVQNLIDIDLSHLYPNSMVMTKTGEIYLGMRMFAVRIKPTENGYVQEWLLPQNCLKIAERDFDCKCVNAK